MKKVLSKDAILKMQGMMLNETVNKKVELAPGDGKTYSRYDIDDDGTVTVGETRFRFWNRLIGCQRKLSFESWALAVWDALVDLSTGLNAKALEEGLSVEIAKKAQREEDYEYVVRRLNDCYEHVCNGKGAVSAGTRDENGSSVVHHAVHADGGNVVVNIKADGFNRVLRYPDATGKNFLKFLIGVTGVEVERD